MQDKAFRVMTKLRGTQGILMLDTRKYSENLRRHTSGPVHARRPSIWFRLEMYRKLVTLSCAPCSPSSSDRGDWD